MDLNLKATQEVIVIIGDSGGDGGGWMVTPKGLKKIPDNNPELAQAFKAIVRNYAVLKKGLDKEVVQRG
ncbi:MAG TPA: hypothetical protein VFT87_00905 [Candidatus Saccharimonadales bacterium]|nr:hypothetical protein [Candidatus Saccharimonadales bacterium]